MATERKPCEYCDSKPFESHCINCPLQEAWLRLFEKVNGFKYDGRALYSPMNASLNYPPPLLPTREQAVAELESPGSK